MSRIDGSDEEDHNHHGKKHYGKHKKESGGQELRRYLHGPGIDEPLAVEQKGRVYYYLADGLGSITALTDHRGRVIQEYGYDSFGNMKKRGNKVKQPYTFTGREWDKEIGLYYRARYYDPEVGRFISFDPILHPMKGQEKSKLCSQNISYPVFESFKQKPQKFTPYVYAEGNPINLIDPMGLKSCGSGLKQYLIPDTWFVWYSFSEPLYLYYDAKVGRFISFDPILHPVNGPLKKIACGQNYNSSLTPPSFVFLLQDTGTGTFNP